MKTSKIIFITLLSSIALLMISGALDWRLRGEKRHHLNLKDLKTGTQSIPGHSFLRVEGISNMEVIASDTSRFEFYYENGSSKPEVIFALSGDTLVINGVKNADRALSLKMYRSSQLNRLYCERSTVSFKDFSFENMEISLNEARLFYNGKNSCRSLELVADNKSYADLRRVKIDSINIDLNQSELYLERSINFVSAALSNHSRLNSGQINNLVLKKDDSSETFIYVSR